MPPGPEPPVPVFCPDVAPFPEQPPNPTGKRHSNIRTAQDREDIEVGAMFVMVVSEFKGH